MKFGPIVLLIGILLLVGGSQVAALLSINPNANFAVSVSPSGFNISNNQSYNFTVSLTPLVGYAMNLKFRASSLPDGVTAKFVCPGVLGPNILLVDATYDGYAPRNVAGTVAVGEVANGIYQVLIEANVDMGEYFAVGILTLTQTSNPVPTETTTTTVTATTTATTTTTTTAPTPPQPTGSDTRQALQTAGIALVLLGALLTVKRR